MSGLPQGWAEATVVQLAGKNGVVTDGDWVESKDQDPAGTVRLIQLADVGDGFFVDKSNRYMNTDAVEHLNCTYLRPGDVLIARMPDPLGRACIFPDIGRDAVTAVDVFVWRPDEVLSGALPRWLMHSINSPQVRAILQSEAGGTTRQRVAGGKIKALTLPVPPLPEQKRLVAKVDGLTARTARARADLDRIPTLIARYKQRLLALAFSGELTAGWRKAQGEQGDQMSSFIGLWEVPNTWDWLRVDQVGTVGLGRQRSPKYHEGADMRPYIRSANITWAGFDISDVKEMNFDAKDFERFQLKYGDVLLNEGSGSAKEVGKPAIWRDEIPNCCYQNTVLRVQPRKCTSEYLYWYFLLTALSERFVSSTQGMNIQHISKDGLARYMVPVPMPTEQNEITRRIESAFNWLDRMAADHAAASKLVPKLDAAILAKAFRGELVPQDPTDEPASALLERIKMQTAEAPAKGRRKRTETATMASEPKPDLLTDSLSWPTDGLAFDAISQRLSLPYEQLKQAVFAALGGEEPELVQTFDADNRTMRLRRAKP